MVIPEGVTNIAAYAFYNCENLQSVTIPESVTVIGNSALAAHGSLPTEADAARMAQQAAIVMEMLERYLPEARQLARGEGRGLVAEAEVRV